MTILFSNQAAENLLLESSEHMLEKCLNGMVANGSDSFGNERRTFHIIDSTTTEIFRDYRIEATAIEILKII